ncbi:MAG: GrpB family protein [Candidatus Aminicenantes bacterium]|nr:GrpB family protein [Candidatus Aminicenantes bacterium]
METLEEKIQRVTAEEVDVVPYDPRWPILFEMERNHLRACLPLELIGRIAHFGSTAVPGLPAKPIVDILAEAADLAATRRKIVPILEGQGYDYFWRPSFDDDRPPFYAWFIKRDASGKRTHHIHMVERDSELWDRLLFRDYLINHPGTAREYGALKMRLGEMHRGDRVAYTRAKTDFIVAVTRKAKESTGPEAADRGEGLSPGRTLIGR